MKFMQHLEKLGLGHIVKRTHPTTQKTFEVFTKINTATMEERSRAVLSFLGIDYEEYDTACGFETDDSGDTTMYSLDESPTPGPSSSTRKRESECLHDNTTQETSAIPVRRSQRNWVQSVMKVTKRGQSQEEIASTIHQGAKHHKTFFM